MTHYLLSVWGNETEMAAVATEDMERMYAQVDEFNTELQKSGAWVFAGGLEPSPTATTIDGRGSEPILTDGPFLETKEQLGGFWIIEAPDLDAALAYATRGSKACEGRVEVRPFQPVPKL